MTFRWKISTNSPVYLTELAATDHTSAAPLLNDRGLCDNMLLVPYPYSEADFDDFYEITQAATEQNGQPVNFAIRNETGTMIGGFGVKELTEGHRCEIGYWLGRPHWGKGIMTHVVRTMTPYVMDQWNLVRVSACTLPTNLASARVLEKVGFEYEGLLKKLHKKDDQFIDSRVYSFVRDA